MSISDLQNSPDPTIATSEGAERLFVENLLRAQPDLEIPGWDVIEGLSQTPKTLPPKYFYDDRGSQLFEQICELPEYYLTRTEAAILQNHAAAIVAQTGACELVELGSGSSTKTRSLLSAFEQAGHPMCYRPIDVSAGILTSSAQQLLSEYPKLKIHALVSTYEQGLQQLHLSYLPHRMISFLGSSLGNLSPQECDRFFAQIAASLRSGDFFLLGVDLHKSTAQLESAYNDNQGITAAFNLNILHHLNHRFGANFDVTQFEHWAFYNEANHQIEMHLRSLKPQTVTLTNLNLTLELTAGETIRSEISRKFDRRTLQAQLQQQQLDLLHIWTDPHQWFAVMLFQRP
jgi:dimethylhistidine N-methyltransferase